MTVRSTPSLVPVKPPARGKSRLVGPPTTPARALAAAFALDTVARLPGRRPRRRGARGHRRRALRPRLGARWAARRSPTGSPATSTRPCAQAAAEARRRWPDLVPVAVCADLPALRAGDLDAALARVAADGRRLRRGCRGLGTTLYTAPYDALRPAVRAGLADGAPRRRGGEIDGRPASLRRDVDDLDDLRRPRRSASGRTPRPLPPTRTQPTAGLPRRGARHQAFVAGSADSWRTSWPGLLGRRLLRRSLLGGGLLGRGFFAVAFAVVAFLAGAFLAAVVFAAVDLLGGASTSWPVAFFARWRCLLRGGLLGRRLLRRVAFLAGVDFFAVVFLAGASSWRPPSWRSAAFVGERLLGGRLLAAAAAPARLLRGRADAASVSFGSFFAPETTFLRSAPALNFGTAFFFALIRSPVWGLRTQRASRTRFSKEPKPVMATFSPLATSRVIVSRTDSSACAACLAVPLVTRGQCVDELRLVH